MGVYLLIRFSYMQNANVNTFDKIEFSLSLV